MNINKKLLTYVAILLVVLFAVALAYGVFELNRRQTETVVMPEVAPVEADAIRLDITDLNEEKLASVCAQLATPEVVPTPEVTPEVTAEVMPTTAPIPVPTSVAQ